MGPAEAKEWLDFLHSGGVSAVLLMACVILIGSVGWLVKKIFLMQADRVSDQKEFSSQSLSAQKMSLDAITATHRVVEANTAAIQAANQKLETLSALIHSKGR